MFGGVCHRRTKGEKKKGINNLSKKNELGGKSK
jgi:hypothetical protein